MATWHEITRDPEYQELTPEGKSLVKKGFFDRVIAADPEYQTFSEDTKKAIFDDFWQTPDDTGQGYVTSMLGAAGRGFGEMGPGIVEGVGALVDSDTIRGAGQDLRSGLESISPVNPIYAESIPVKLAGVGGQVGSVLATAGAGGLAGKALGGVGAVSKGAQTAALGSAFLQGSAEGAREAEQYGMTGPEAYLRTLAGGAIEAGTEFLPFGLTAETALAKRLLTGAPRTGTFLGAVGSEAGEEGLGQVASNIATKALAPAGVETPGITEGALEAAAYGAAGGAMIGGVNALISTPPERQTQIQKDLQAEVGAIPKDTVPDQTNEEKIAAMEAGGTTVVDPDGKTAVIPPAVAPEEQPSMPLPDEIVIAEENLKATENVPFTDVSGQAVAAIIEQNNQIASQPAIQLEQAAEEVGVEVTPSPAMEMPKKSSQTITGSNGEIAPEMPVPVESTVTSPGEAPLSEGVERNRAIIAEAAAKLRGEAPQDISAGLRATIPPSLPETGPPVVDQEAPAGTPVQAAPIQPVETQEDAVQEQIPDEGVLRQERPKMELQGVGEGNIQPEEVAETSQAGEKVAPREGVYNLETRTNFAELPASVRGDRFVLSPVTGMVFDRMYAQYVTPPAFTRPDQAVRSLNESRYNADVSLPVSLGRSAGGADIFTSASDLPPVVIPQQTPSPPTTGAEPPETLPAGQKVTPGGVATERDLTKPEQMNPDEFTPIGNPVNQGIFKSKKEASARLAELEDTISKSPQMMGILSEFNLTPSDAYEVAKDTRGRWSLGATHKHRVALAARERLPVSAAAVDTYGIKLPEGYVKQGDLYIFQPQTKQAAEKQTPVPLREGTGAAGVVQSEPVEGSIPTVEKVSTETESESSGNLPAVEQIDRLVQSGAKPEEMDKFVKSLTDDQFNELVASEAFDVEPKLAIKPKDTYDAKRIKRRKFVDAVNASTKEVRKTAQQVFQEEEAAAKKQQAGEEMRSKAIDSIIGAAEKKKRKFGQVTNSDAIAAVAMLVSSKDVPGVLTTWTGTKDEFLRDPANQTADPEIYARIKAGELVEGFFNKGRAYVFLDGIGVSDEDMLRGEQMSVTPQVAAVRRVLLHESLVHRGIHGLPLRHRRLILNWVRQNSTPAELDDLAKLYTEYANWRNSDYEFEALAEELLAKKVDSLTEIPKDGPMARLIDILRQIWDFIVGYKREPTLSDLKSVIKLLKSGAEALANDRLKDGGEVKLSMIAPTAGITPEMDAEYLAAVEAGDMEKAQRMVDEAAKAAGYTSKVFHGTIDKEPTKLGKSFEAGEGVFTTDNPDVAHIFRFEREYGEVITEVYDGDADEYVEVEPGALLELYIRPGKQLDLSKTGISPQRFTDDTSLQAQTLREAIRDGYDSILVPDVSEGVGGWTEKGTTTILFKTSDLKRSDPVTYDDSGNVIPLSQRFQTASQDIRFSRPQFSSDTSAALSAGSEAARSTLYSERDMDIREAIRRAYEAMPKTNSVAVPIGELFAKTEELMPGVTQDEFSLVLQDLFEDNGAVLQEGEVVKPLTERDRRYLAAVESGDLDAAQEFVDKAAGRFASMEEQNPSEFSYGDENDQFFYHVTTKDRLEQVVYDGEGLVPNKGGQFAGAAAQTNSRGKVFFTERSGVKVWMNQVEQQLENSRDYDEDQSPEDDLAVIRIPKHLVSDKQDDDPRNSPVQVGRDFFSTKPIPAWPETVVRDDQGRIIPLSRRFDTGADIRGQINVTTPEGRRAGFVVVMPRAAKASRIKADDATDAAKTFQDDIIEAGKGRIDTASYQGNTLKSTEAPDHNVNAPELYKDAAISLVDSLLKKHSITDIADSFQDPEFRVAVGLLGNKAVNPNVAQQAELFTGAVIQKKLEKALNDESDPAKKRLIEKTLKNHKAYYTVATGIGQNLNAVGALQQDPDFKGMFLFNEAEKEMADKAKDKLDTITGGTQPVTDMVNQSEEAAADEATKQIEESVEEDEYANLVSEGEAELNSEEKGLWERAKMLLRRFAMYAKRKGAKAANAAKASLSPEQRKELDELNAIMAMSDDEAAKAEAKDRAEFASVLKKLLGEDKASDLPEQKKTRAKRKKMVDTAKKRAEAGKNIDISDTESAVKIVLREMGKARPGKQVPLTKLMPWKDILAQKAKTVEEYRQRILDAMMASDAFKEVSDEDKAKIADIFAKQWDKKRTDILDRMLEREIERKRREGSLSEAAAKALQKSRNKIIELANLGGFDNDDLMKVLGEKFGIKTGFSEAEKARISELADKLQDETLNPAKRNKLAMEFAVTLAGASEIPVAEIIANWWTSSVLFGPQTIFSIGAAFVNGAYSITTIGTRRMLADLTRGDVKGAIEESILMLQGIAKYLGAFKQAGRRAWSYLWTGNVDVLGAAANDILGEINSLEELKRFKRHKLLAENLAKDPRALRRYVGMYLRFVNRLLTSLDAFNVMVTKAGTASLALRMSGMSTDNIIKAEKMLNLKAYKDQVIRDYFDNKAPTTLDGKALVDSYAEAEMYRAVDQLGGKMENADYLASESAMTMNPTGLGGFFYRSITGLDSKMKKAAEDYLEKAKKDWTTEKDLESALFLGLAYFRQFAVQNLGGVAGYKFIRFASNKFNQGISYLPMVGLLRTLEAKGDEIKGKEAFIETIHRNQAIGAVLTLAAIAVVKALEEEPDDEKRGNFWNGGWENLTPDQKKQMLAKGQKEYTMGFKFNGRWYVFNYQNWPLNQVLAAIGSMSDQIRFSPKQWKEKGALSKPLAGIVSGLKSTLEIPALSQLGELAGNRLASKDPTEQTVDRLSRVAAGWVGGFVPRILKDLDFATQPETRKYKTLWEKTASHIPIYRRYVGEDYYDILGQPIKRNVIPGSREFMMGPTEPEYRILGALNSRNIFLTPANAEYRMVGKGRNRRRLTQEEADAYSLETGKGYRQMLIRYGQRALQMPTERARAFLQDKADEVRDRALKKVYRGYK